MWPRFYSVTKVYILTAFCDFVVVAIATSFFLIVFSFFLFDFKAGYAFHVHFVLF